MGHVQPSLRVFRAYSRNLSQSFPKLSSNQHMLPSSLPATRSATPKNSAKSSSISHSKSISYDETNNSKRVGLTDPQKLPAIAQGVVKSRNGSVLARLVSLNQR
jgi:hypothetical protein